MMSAGSGISLAGLVVMVLGWLAAMIAPKVPPDNVDDPGAWITPDDYSVQAWTAVMFVVGFALVGIGLISGEVADRLGWDELAALGVVCAVLGALTAWGFIIWTLTRNGADHG